MFDSDSMAAYYFDQGLDAYLSGENEQEAAVRCAHCKRDGFHWEKTVRGWRLHTETGKMHICKAYSVQKGET